MNQIRNLFLMSQDTEGALCSHLTLTDLTSAKFLMDTDLFVAWVSAPLWLGNGKTQAIYFRHQKSSQSPLRLRVDSVWLANHRVSETSSKPAEEKTQAKSTASCSRQYHPSLLTSSLNTVCQLTKETSHRCGDSRTATEQNEGAKTLPPHNSKPATLPKIASHVWPAEKMAPKDIHVLVPLERNRDSQGKTKRTQVKEFSDVVHVKDASTGRAPWNIQLDPVHQRNF